MRPDTIDEGVIAIVGEYLIGADGTTAWQEAGIPMIGTMPIEAEDFTNPAVWPITGGALAGTPGLGVALQQAGAKTIAVITGDAEAGRALPSLIKPALEEESDLVNETYLSLDPSADYTPQLAQLASANPDGIAVIGSTDINARAIAGLRQAGYTGLLGVPGTGVSPSALEDLGDAAEGLIVVSSFAAPTDTENEAHRPLQRRHGRVRRRTPCATSSRSTRGRRCTCSPRSSPPSTRSTRRRWRPPWRATRSTSASRRRSRMGVPNNQLGVPRIFTVTFQPQIVEDGEIVASGDFVDLTQVIGG